MRRVILKREWMNRKRGTVIALTDGMAMILVDRGTAEIYDGPIDEAGRPTKQQRGRLNKQVQESVVDKAFTIENNIT